MNVEIELASVLDSFETRAPQEIIDAARNELGHGEFGIALENFCEQIFEASVELDGSDLSTIENLATAMGIADNRWAFLKELEVSTPATTEEE